MEDYDVAIIGAGMSGLAAGIRLAHFGKRVCIFESHNAPGGLNSFYSIDGRKYDVGLHAMTNYARPGMRKAPLSRVLRQLRISFDELGLAEQVGSRVAFPGLDLRFGNDFELLRSEVAEKFPAQVDGFAKLVQAVEAYEDPQLNKPYQSAREVARSCLSDPLLEEMLFCPLMYYGSASEDDMDFGQFSIMFRSIFMEGLGRPREGVRRVIRLLLDRFRKSGGIRKMKTGVARIESDGRRARKLVLENGEEARADIVISSAGLPETLKLCHPPVEERPERLVGQLAFAETITVFRQEPAEFGWGDDTIVFFNDSERFAFRRSEDPIDLRSGVICVPNNFRYEGGGLEEGTARVTCLASYSKWKSYPEERYVKEKAEWRERIWQSACRFMPPSSIDPQRDALARDMFTPRTVEKFTRHLNGAIYGSPTKVKDGRTPLENLFICGTDQGFLGIVGALLSGITVANLYALKT